MRYIGGKFRLRNQIAGFIQPYVTERYFEPFCGSAWVGERIVAPVRVFSDSHPELIALWNAVMMGWHPPEKVSELGYKMAMAGFGEPYLRGFIGFGCSYSGKWFGGYARDNSGRNYAGNARSQLIKRRPRFAGSHFVQFDYREILSLTKPGDVVYCDPPYRGTTGYDGIEKFDHDEFWETCRATAYSGVRIFISEYQAPPDFTCVLEMPTRTSLRTKESSGQDRIERLFSLT
jgi:DNA adenine methylase